MCNLLEQGAKELGMSIREYYSKAENVARAQLIMQDKYAYDNVWGFSYAASLAEMLGSKNTIFADDGPPNVGHMVLQKPEDIRSFEIPQKLEDTRAGRFVIDCVDLLRKKIGGKVPVVSSNVASFSLPAILIGMEKWYELLFLGPFDLRDELLEKCVEFNAKLVPFLRTAGIDMIAYGNPLSSPEFITNQQFRNLCLPWVKRDVEAFGIDGIVYFNGGGPINSTINEVIEATGLGAFYIHPNDDIKEAKAIINGRGLSSGVINDILLINYSPQQIKEEVKRIMNEGKEGGGFIFGTLMMPYYIPEKNIRLMLEAAFEYGTY
jgi:uroporphyrinogen decarboxylase